MESSLRILLLEDSPDDATLTEHELLKAGLQFASHRCETQESFERLLVEFEPHVILSDYSMPHFSGLAALQIARSKRPEVPFILVSGAIGEDLAIQVLKSGATDYVLKSRLSRLAPAVQRALTEVEERAERKRMEEALRASEEQFRQAQKMEAVGRLAGGVAHDFNNMLMVIRGYADMLMEVHGPGDPSRTALEEIEKAAERATTLTRQLLTFSRKQVFQPRVLDLNHTVRELDNMLRRLITDGIHLTSVLPTDLGRCSTDPGQIEQVIVNLAVNAADAMPRGGSLRIETANVVLDEAFCRVNTDAKPGPYLKLEVQDTGCGMDKETQSHIFEPFFTTKAPDKGTGLGLSTVYGIVKQSGGCIEVVSEPDRGTAFRIYFPRVTHALAVAEKQATPSKPLRGSETILLVEDDSAVREVALQALTHFGYAVLPAEGFEQARVLCETDPHPIHLLLSDVIMPGVSGLDLVKRLTELRQGMKVLLMSGFAGGAVSSKEIAGAGIELLLKPFKPEALANKVREVLDSPRGAPVLGAVTSTSAEKA